MAYNGRLINPEGDSEKQLAILGITAVFAALRSAGTGRHSRVAGEFLALLSYGQAVTSRIHFNKTPEAEADIADLGATVHGAYVVKDGTSRPAKEVLSDALKAGTTEGLAFKALLADDDRLVKAFGIDVTPKPV